MTPCIFVNTNIFKEINAHGSFYQDVGTHLANSNALHVIRQVTIVKSINIVYYYNKDFCNIIIYLIAKRICSR
jgi:predicted lactoylglutathione lyase